LFHFLIQLAFFEHKNMMVKYAMRPFNVNFTSSWEHESNGKEKKTKNSRNNKINKNPQIQKKIEEEDCYVQKVMIYTFF
jgi:hypothetical protein